MLKLSLKLLVCVLLVELTAFEARPASAQPGSASEFPLSENIAGGTNLSPVQAVSWWRGDALHQNTMLGASYQHIGAGTAVSGGFVYDTIDVAYSSENVQANPTPSVVADSAAVTPGVTPTSVVQVATPSADGSITHKVGAGQTLITIAEAYGVSLAELFELNGMNKDSVIYPGDELVIRASFTPTPTSPPTKTAAPTKIPTSTRRPTSTPQPQEEETTGGGLAVQAQPENSPSAVPEESTPDRIGNVLLAIVAILGIGGVVLIAVGSLLRRAG